MQHQRGQQLQRRLAAACGAHQHALGGRVRKGVHRPDLERARLGRQAREQVGQPVGAVDQQQAPAVLSLPIKTLAEEAAQ